jgi:hypothetical protein
MNAQEGPDPNLRSKVYSLSRWFELALNLGKMQVFGVLVGGFEGSQFMLLPPPITYEQIYPF